MAEERPVFNFEEDNSIDLDNLHEEWQQHSQIRKKYADEISYLEKIVKKAEEKIKVTRSQLTKKAMENPKECCNTEKTPTAPLIEAYYRTHPDHEAAKNEWIEATYNLSMAWNALKAFDDRKTALENEVILWTRNYFATPREERMVDGGKRILMMQDRQNDETAQGQRKELNKKRVRKGDA